MNLAIRENARSIGTKKLVISGNCHCPPSFRYSRLSMIRQTSRKYASAWEQSKLGDCSRRVMNKLPIERFCLVSVANGIYPASESNRETNPGASLANYKIVHFGDVVYNSMRMWQGCRCKSVRRHRKPRICSSKAQFRGLCTILSRLLRQPMLLKQYQQVSQGNSKDTQVLKFDDFASIGISMPASENEQRRIGGFFSRLDHLITLHQRKRLWFAK